MTSASSIQFDAGRFRCAEWMRVRSHHGHRMFAPHFRYDARELVTVSVQAIFVRVSDVHALKCFASRQSSKNTHTGTIVTQPLPSRYRYCTVLYCRRACKSTRTALYRRYVLRAQQLVQQYTTLRSLLSYTARTRYVFCSTVIITRK